MCSIPRACSYAIEGPAGEFRAVVGPDGLRISMHSRAKSSVTARHLIRWPVRRSRSPGSRSGWSAWRQPAVSARRGTSWPCCAGVPPSPAYGRGDTPSCGWYRGTRFAACRAPGDSQSAAAALLRRGCASAAGPCRRPAAAGGDRHRGGAPQDNGPCARGSWRAPASGQWPCACPAGLALYLEADLEGFKIQAGLGQQVLEPGHSRPPAPSGFLGIHAAVPSPPLVERGLAEAALPADLLDRQARFGLLQETDDLLLP